MICSLKFKKDVLILGMLLCFGFCAFDFEAMPHPSCYFTSIVDKTHHGLIVPPFCCFFRYGGFILVSK